MNVLRVQTSPRSAEMLLQRRCIRCSCGTTLTSGKVGHQRAAGHACSDTGSFSKELILTDDDRRLPPHRAKYPLRHILPSQGRWRQSDDAPAVARFLQRHSLQQRRVPLRRAVQSTAIDERQSSTAAGDSHRREHAADSGHRCVDSIKAKGFSIQRAGDSRVHAGRKKDD